MWGRLVAGPPTAQPKWQVRFHSGFCSHVNTTSSCPPSLPGAWQGAHAAAGQGPDAACTVAVALLSCEYSRRLGVPVTKGAGLM